MGDDPLRISAIALQAYGLYEPSYPRPFGGAELQLKLLTEALAQQDDMVSQLITLGPEKQTTEHNGVTLDVIARRAGWVRALTSYDVFRTLGRAEPAVVLQRGFGYETAIAAHYCKNHGAAFVHMLAHDDDVAAHVAGSRDPARVLHRFALQSAQLIFAQHREQQNALKEVLGLDAVIFRSAHPMPEPPAEPGDALLWVGRCVEWKQPELFLDVVQALPGQPACMICPPAEDREYYEKIAARANALPNCTFYGGLPLAETEAQFARARVFVLTSRKEGFPNTLIQACKYGCPVAALQVNPDEMITHYELGGCTDGDTEKLTELVRQLATDDARHGVCRENALRYARQEHDIARLGPELARYLRELVQTT